MATTVASTTLPTATRRLHKSGVQIASDGTLFCPYWDNAAGVWKYVYATDYTSPSFSAATTITNASVEMGCGFAKLSNDNIICVYARGLTTTGFSFRLLTKSGSTWTLGSEVTWSGPDYNGSHIPVVVDSNGVYFCAFLHFNGSAWSCQVYYSNDSGATWTASTNLANGNFGNTSSAFDLVRWGGGSPGVALFTGGGTNIYMKYRADSDGLTTWSAVNTDVGNDIFNDGIMAADWDGGTKIVIGYNYDIGSFLVLSGVAWDTSGHTFGTSSDLGSADDIDPCVINNGSKAVLFYDDYRGSANEYDIYSIDYSSGFGAAAAQIAGASVNRRYVSACKAPDAGYGLMYMTGTSSPWTVSYDRIAGPVVAATREQEGYRFRADDGSESTATWLASQDTNISRAKSVNTRLRILTNVTGDAPSEGLKLQYRRANGADEWKDVD